ncbi:hypothetical protein [Mycolicibacterium austroafricanum]|uniref:hypothetical protein n=1 Tax=Mycolicibacterium austroafricanum TaxID=39687 RepID=UPI001CA3480D|nr:hypothetical protein [Mycolicibacterium austroafricanum]QZT61265.1 hypothetical protein JN085_20065 [Mycolicibacterium austroafricanum]
MDERMSESAAEVIAAELEYKANADLSVPFARGRVANAVLDALREAGWELVKLPEPTGRWAEGPEWRDFISGAIHAVVWTGDAPGSTVMVQNVEPGSLTPDQAHDLAAALLAAAAAVSQGGESDA